MDEPFKPGLLRDAASQLPGIDPSAVEAVVERGIQFARRLSRPVPDDAYPLLAVSLRAGVDDLVLATKVIDEVSRPELPPVLVTMVTTAVLSRDLDDPAAAVRAVLDRGAELAASLDDGTRPPLIGQITGYRAALDELTGDVPDLDTYATQLAMYTTDLTTFARFLGGEQAFLQLTHTEPDVPELDETEYAGTASDEETITAWVLAELYAGTTAAQRRVVTDWLTGLRSPTSQDDLVFLVDRIRRVERRVTRCPATPPNLLELPEHVRGAVRTAVRNGLSFPPLWTNREAAVKLAAGKLRLEMTGHSAAWPTAMLVAGVVVRSLCQDVRQAADPGRPLDCGCGAGLRSLRTTRPPDEVCPHRPWPEPGHVEDHTTLARTTRLGDEHLTQLHLKRYQGRWQEWVGDARDRMD